MTSHIVKRNFSASGDAHGRCIRGALASMSYEAFTVEQLKQDFSLVISRRTGVFDAADALPPSDHLRDALAEGAPLAMAIATEKARSELIIAPILMEVRRQLRGAVGLFSGSEFVVNPQYGLAGRCDFLLSRSWEQLSVEAPVVVVVEAANDSPKPAIAPCIAKMVGAQAFNAAYGVSGTVYGVVTTGSHWTFLRLDDAHVVIDLREHYLRDIDRVVGILVAMVQGVATVHTAV